MEEQKKIRLHMLVTSQKLENPLSVYNIGLKLKSEVITLELSSESETTYTPELSPKQDLNPKPFYKLLIPNTSIIFWDHICI